MLATARRGSVGFDLWSSIRNARLTAGRFTLEAPELGLIRTQEGRIQLLGQSALPERDKPFALEQLPTGRFHVRNAVVSFRDAITGRGPWSLSGVNFDVTRNSTLLELYGDASLPRTLGRELRFSATVEGPLQDAAALVSTFSVDGRDLDLAGWADVLPDAWPAPETGKGTVEVRGALKGAALIQLAADVDLSQLVAVPPMWTTPCRSQSRWIPTGVTTRSATSRQRRPPTKPIRGPQRARRTVRDAELSATGLRAACPEECRTRGTSPCRI